MRVCAGLLPPDDSSLNIDGTMHLIRMLLALALIGTTGCIAPSQGENRLHKSLSRGWKINVMTEAPRMIDNEWVAIDAFNEQLHVLYFHSTREHKPNYLIHGYSPNGGLSWIYDTIDGSPDLMGITHNLSSMARLDGSIAVDHCGVPHVFYTVNHYFSAFTGVASWAVHAWKINGAWIRDTIEAREAGEPVIGSYVDMVIGSDNEPRVAYICGEYDYKVRVRIKGKWSVESKVEGMTIESEHPWTLLHYGLLPLGRDSFRIGTFPEVRNRYIEHERIRRDAEGTVHLVRYEENDSIDQAYVVYASSIDSGRTWRKEIVEYVESIYAQEGIPDLVVTDELIGIFYKGKGDIPRFAYKKHSKPNFRKSRKSYCGQDDS